MRDDHVLPSTIVHHLCKPSSWRPCATQPLTGTTHVHRYQMWRKRQLNQRKAVHKLVRRVLGLAVPLGLGTLAYRTQPQLRSAVGGVRQRLGQTSQSVQQELAAVTGSKQEHKPQEAKPKKKFGSLF